VDEANSSLSEITWVSPVARALLGKRLGDEVLIRTPSGSEFVEVVAIQYLGY
jgi:transcription elongation factor GreB